MAGLCLLSSDHPDDPDVFPGGWLMPPVFGPPWLPLRLSWWLVYVCCLRITLVTLTSFLVAGLCLLSSGHPDYPDVSSGGWFMPPVFGPCLSRWLVYSFCLRITLITLMSFPVAGLCLLSSDHPDN